MLKKNFHFFFNIFYKLFRLSYWEDIIIYIDTSIKATQFGKEHKLSRKENLKKAKKIFEIESKKMINDSKKWLEFLEFSSRFYKYSFTENLLMFAQAPEVTMCATFDEWNSIGRWVKPQSKGIKVLYDTNDNVCLKYVFDVTDTYKNIHIQNAYSDEKLKKFKWETNEEQTMRLLKEHLDTYSNKFDSIIAEYVMEELSELYETNLSEEEHLLLTEGKFYTCLATSVAYQVAKRCNIELDISSNFDRFYEIVNDEISLNMLGTLSNKYSSELLNVIEKGVKREELRNEVKKIWKYSEEEFERDVSNEIQSINNEWGTNGQVIDEGTRDTYSEGNNRETTEREESSTSNERVYSDSQIQSDDRINGGGIITTDVDRESIDDIVDEEVEETTSFSFVKNEVSDELINKLLSSGGNVQDSVKRIKEILNNDTLTTKEQIVAIRNEYGDAGASSKEYYWESRAKGLTIIDKNSNAEITLKWSEVHKRMKKIFQIENEQMGIESIFNLANQKEENIETDNKEKERFVAGLIGKEVYIQDKLYRVDAISYMLNEVTLFDIEMSTIYPLSRVEKIDRFYELYHDDEKNFLNIIEEQKEKQEKINYKIEDNELSHTTLKKKYQENINAIKLLKTIESEERFATQEEQEILSKYNGWGGMSKAFEDDPPDEWKEQAKELKKLLTNDEYVKAKSTVLNAYYTEPLIVDYIYKGLERLGFKGGNILEPSARCG